MVRAVPGLSRAADPLQNFVSIGDDKIGLTLATRGLPEYQTRRDDQGTTLLLTLLRCVGWLSRDDLVTRSGHAGPALETPGAQEIGVHEFEYALISAAGDWRNTFADAHAFVTPLRAIATSVHSGSLASAASFVDVTPREFVISAIKPAEDGQGLIVRGYNIGDQSLDVMLHFSRKFRRAARVNLNEEEITPLDLRDGCEVRLSVKGKEIVTWKCMP
jgi:alpha-mannosidase